MPEVEQRPPPTQPHDLELNASFAPRSQKSDKQAKNDSMGDVSDPHAFHREEQERKEKEGEEDRASSGVKNAEEEKALSLLDQQVTK
jgi:hypothetical protein